MELKYEDTIKNYVSAMNNINLSLPEILENIDEDTELYKSIKYFIKMYNELLNIAVSKQIFYFEMMRKISEFNKGYIQVKFLNLVNMPREYYKIFEEKNYIKKIMRGVYILNDNNYDELYVNQLKYKSMIYSHETALSFFGINTESKEKSISVPRGYHDQKLFSNFTIYSSNKKFFNLGLISFETKDGNLIRTYDLERSICDVIKFKKRIGLNNVYSIITQYNKMDNRNIEKLELYASTMNIYDKVMSLII